MIKKANTDHPTHEFMENRWSSYKFAGCLVSKEELFPLVDPAFWAPFSYNE